MGYPEEKDIRTGKARKHQKAAEKGKNKKTFKVEYFEKFGAMWKTQRDIKPQTSLKTAMSKATNSIKKMERKNVESERDLRPQSYGVFEIPMMRIVEYVNGKHKKSYPVTDDQKKEMKSNVYIKDIYNAEKGVDLQYLIMAYMKY